MTSQGLNDISKSTCPNFYLLYLHQFLEILQSTYFSVVVNIDGLNNTKISRSLKILEFISQQCRVFLA